MKEPIFVAHRGVSTECPENTMPAFEAAVTQGYGMIELDPEVALDGKIVILHDKTINRTARTKSGDKIEQKAHASDLTYAELLGYDFGIFFSNKYKGTKLPLLSDIFDFADKARIQLKIDNKFQKFDISARQKIYTLARKSGAKIGFTCNELQYINEVISELPDATIHYDGIVTEDILSTLASIVPKERLCIWVPIKSKRTDWVKVDFINDRLSQLIKKYAQLGIWIVDSEEEYDLILKYQPDYVETTGRIKPTAREGLLADIHLHSEHSHDGRCPITAMADSASKRDISLITVTDHCDVEFCDTLDLDRMVSRSIEDSKSKKNARQDVTVLSGIELGGGFWNFSVADRLLKENPCDLVIGSVHSVLYKDLTMPYSQINFGRLGRDETIAFLWQYFDDVMRMLQETDIDLLAHLTCPFRYINGKYEMGIDCHIFEEKIEEILKFIIAHGIPMEVNTSCLGSAYDEFMPEEWIIKKYRELGGYLITCASDAHTDDRCGHEFDRLTDMLDSQGFKNIYYFKNRILHQCRIKRRRS